MNTYQTFGELGLLVLGATGLLVVAGFGWLAFEVLRASRRPSATPEHAHADRLDRAGDCDCLACCIARHPAGGAR